MPIKHAPNSDADTADVQVREGVEILSSEGELSLAARVASDFLSDADFEPVMAHESAVDHLVIDDLQPLDESGNLPADDESDEIDEGKVPPQFLAKQKKKKGDKKDDDDSDEKDESVDQPGIAYLPGGVAAKLVDEDDLAECFAHYLDNRPRTTLSEKSAVAYFQDLLDIEEMEDGCFTAAVADETNRAALSEMLIAMIAEADVVCIGTGDDSDIDEGVLNKRRTASQKAQAARVAKKPKSGARKKELKMARRERKRTIGKSRRMEKKRAKRFARRHGMNADAYAGVARIFNDIVEGDDVEMVRPIIGFGCAVESSPVPIVYEIATVESVEEEVLEAHVEEMGAYGGKMAGSMAKKKGAKKHESCDDDDDDDDDKKDKKKKSKSDKGEKKPTAEANFQPRQGAEMLHERVLMGGSPNKVERANLSEGAALAAAMPMLTSAHAPKKTEEASKK